MMRTRFDTFDVLVVGAGPAGLTATLLLADLGLEVACVDRVAGDRPGAELRTVALLTPSVELLRRAGALERLIDGGVATELAAMRVVDAGGDDNSARVDARFDALDVDQPIFGWNVANSDLTSALRAAAEAAPRVRLFAPAEIAHLAFRDDAVRASLADGRGIAARLCVGADGRNSQVRGRLGVGVRTIDYGQRAMTFHVAHERPHGGVSIEIYRRGGPFTLVPHRPTADVPHRSAVVWMEDNRTAIRLGALDDPAFETEANARSLGVLGPLKLCSARTSWPVISLLADRFAGPRAALIAEAAHVVPPIGAQGLNTSMADVEALVDRVAEVYRAGGDIGGERHLQSYAAVRRRDSGLRVAATAALDVASIGAARPIRDARALGLAAVDRIAPLKRLAMRAGLGG